jgi:hypothetical protein
MCLFGSSVVVAVADVVAVVDAVVADFAVVREDFVRVVHDIVLID